MKKKEEYLSPVRKRQIELFKKYYDVDEENKLVHLCFHFEKASDILKVEYGGGKNPVIDGTIIENISKTLSKIPLGYKADINFVIDDYEGNKPDELLTALNDSIEIGHYGVLKETRKKGLQIALLIMAGVLCLILMNLGRGAGWFGEGSTEELISEIIDITGWVFIWEAVTLMFISPSEEKTRTILYRKRVNSVSFYEKNNEKPLVKEKCQAIFAEWAEESSAIRSSRLLYLVAGVGLIGTGFSNLIAMIFSFTNGSISYSPLTLTVTIIFTLVLFAFQMLAGISGISSYCGYGHFRKTSGFFGVASLILCVTFLSGTIANGILHNSINWKSIISAIFALFFYIAFAFAWGFSIVSRKENQKSSK